ncbi:hypothetical protein KO525_10040 [Psychrosphaera sp. B3R10]|uniref:Ig-like domain-containing protein n=1 Tax=unclassified Psychrosphaera TaxID=2641570 RepID=UPI001C09F1C8|nr:MULTISPECIES: Ig-like domain-containing protein [unclassified Psychrosphaera]MBU2883537.1 hypothetical protein [Psychrosphaera sp. I2R16]MBU2989716.1 hypothetical protein [Psychrosphaera sp. B3R10]
MLKKILFFGLVPLFFESPLAASSDYPFELPAQLSAKIKIDSNQQENFNNKLLGTNIFKFTSQSEQELINTFNPTTIRFPHGIWANWYDWRTDGTRVFGTDTFRYEHSDGSFKSKEIDHLSSIKVFEQNDTKVGIDGLTDLNVLRKNNLGEGYDMVWTFNMSADGPDFEDGSPDSVERYWDLVNREFNVQNIELGNENFYPGQRSSIIPNAVEYIKRAKSISDALKFHNPNIQLSIPLLRRDNWANPNWNQDVTKESNYFDAVTVHTYVGANPDDETTSDEAYSTALLARYHLAASVNDYAKVVAPNKPVWLTEWGVNSGGANAASLLGMLDVYIYMSENQETYERANWFSVNGQLNSFLVWETYTSVSGVERPRIKYPLEKTAFGSAHEIIREVLQDAVMLGSSIETSELADGVKAISGRAITKSGKIQLLVLNLTNQSTPLAIELDTQLYSGKMTHSAMSFKTLDEERVLPIEGRPLSNLPSTDVVTLPPFSINTIELEDVELTLDRFELELSNGSDFYQFKQNELIKLEAIPNTNSGQVTSVTFYVDGTEISVDESAPFQFNWQPQNYGIQAITAMAKRNDGAIKSSEPLLFNITPDIFIFKAILDELDDKTYDIGEVISITGTIELNIGTTRLVELRVNNKVVQQSESEPYSFNWVPLEAGNYAIDLVATTANQQKVNSNVLTVTVEQKVDESITEEVDSSDDQDNDIEAADPNENQDSKDKKSEASGGAISINYLMLFCLLLRNKRFGIWNRN